MPKGSARFAEIRAAERQRILDADVELLRAAGCQGHAQFLIDERLIKKLEQEHACQIESAERRNACRS